MRFQEAITEDVHDNGGGSKKPVTSVKTHMCLFGESGKGELRALGCNKKLDFN